MGASSSPLVNGATFIGTGGLGGSLGGVNGVATSAGALGANPALKGAIGAAGGAAGTGFDTPQQAQIQQGVNAEQVQQGQTGVNNSLASQQALLAALQGQGGLQAQNQALSQQQAQNNALAAANGIGTQNAAISGLQGVAGQQQGLAQQYQNIAQGRGPNPAQAMLNQQTGQNVANQAALMAGQRGAGANVGLLARQSAQQGAATQQQAVGQGASLQAQQSLNALAGIGAQQQAQAATQQAIGGLGTTQAGMQQAGNTAQAAQANQIAGQQIAGTQAVTQANLANTGQLQGALGAQNQATVSSQGSVNSANAALASKQMEAQQKVLGGAGQGLGSIMGLAQGGEVGGPISEFGQFLHGKTNGLAEGGGPVAAGSSAQKAEKSGNSLENDKIPAMLSEGEVVVPRSVIQSSDPAGNAAKFVAQAVNRADGSPEPESKEESKKEIEEDVEKAEDAPPVPETEAAPTPQTNATMAPPTAPPAPPAPPAVAPVAAPPAPQEGEAPAPEAAPAPKPVPMTPEQNAAVETAKQLGFAQDLSSGKVTPKTYHDLYEKKDTLGKIGTIFGLLLSGAGSGLTGQPNALLGMMNSEIERDVEAQKTNQTNKQNWYKMSLEHERNLAQNNLTNTQAMKAAGESDFQQMVNKRAGIKTEDMVATNKAINMATLGALQDQQNNINMMPPGPQRDQAQALLNNTIKPAAMQAISQRNLQTEQKKTLVNAAANAAGGVANAAGGVKKQVAKKESGGSDDVLDMDKYHKMTDSGNFNEKHGIPLNSKTNINPQDVPKIDEAATKMRVNRNNYKDVMEVYNALAQMPRAGELPAGKFADAFKKIPWVGDALASGAHFSQGKAERPREQLLNALSQRLVAHGASAETMDMMKKALSPSMFDTSETMKTGAELVRQHFAHNDTEASQVLQKYPGLAKGFEEIKFKVPSTPLSEDELKKFGEEGKTKQKESPKPTKKGYGSPFAE